MATTTVGNSSTATKAEIKALAQEQITAATGSTIASQAEADLNTAARHAPVTILDTSEIDLVLSGQQISASIKSASVDETKLDASVNASLGLADSSIQPGDNLSSLTNDIGLGAGTVTSVAASVPTGLTISGSPVTGAGTLAIALDTGYEIPTTTALAGKVDTASIVNVLEDNRSEIPTSHAVSAATDFLFAKVNEPNLGASFSIAVADNSLKAALSSVISPAFTEWQIVIDDDTPPTGTLTNFGAGADTLPSTYTLPDYNQHTYYLWVKDTVGPDIVQVAPLPSQSDNNTIPGLVFQATQTLVAPSPITDFTVTRTVGSETTSLDISFTDAVAGTGAVSYYQLINSESLAIVKSPITSPATISGLASNIQYPWQIKAIDVNGLSSVSNVQVVRTATPSAGIIGIEEISVRTGIGTGYEEEENAGVTPLTVNLTRTNGSSGIVSVLIRQIDKTAATGTNFTKTVEDGTANKVEWADGNTDVKTVDIALLDTTSSSNLCFQFEIIAGSEAGNCTIDNNNYNWGRGDAVLCYINGSAAADAGYQQSSTGDHLLVIPVTDISHAAITAGIQGTWQVEPADDAGMTQTGNVLRPNEWDIPSGATRTTVATGTEEVSVEWPCVFTQTGTHYLWVRMYHPSTGSTDELHIDIDGTGSDFYDVWADNSTAKVSDPSNPRMKWVNYKFYDTVISGNVNAGVRTVKVHKYENTHFLDKILFTTSAAYNPTGVGPASTRNGSPSIDDNWGPSPSVYSSGAAVIDDASNPTYPTPPGVGVVDPNIFVPVDGTSNLNVAAQLFSAEFTGASGLINPVITVTKNGTSYILNGTTTVSGQNSNIASFTPTETLESNTVYNIHITATSIISSSGVESPVDYPADPTDWQVTTINTGTAFIISEDWSGFTAPYQLTGVDNLDTDLHDLFNLKTWQPPTGDLYSIQGIFQNYLRVIDDPGGSVSRGNVLEVKYPGGNRTYQYNSITCYPNFAMANTNIPSPSLNTLGLPTDVAPASTDPKWDLTGGPPDLAAFATRQSRRNVLTEIAYDECYFAYDVRLSDNWYYNFTSKIPGMTTGTNLQSSHTALAVSDGLYACGGTRLQFHNNTAFGNPDGALAFYLYDAHYVQRSLFLRRDGDVEAVNGLNDYQWLYHKTNAWSNCYIMPRSTWVTVEVRWVMNTAPPVLNAGFVSDGRIESQYHNTDAVADGCLNNGLIEVWITDPRPYTSDPLTSGTGGVPIKMCKYTSMWRFHQAFMISKLRLECSTNKPKDGDFLNPTDQFLYLDNIRVSTSPIAH